METIPLWSALVWGAILLGLASLGARYYIRRARRVAQGEQEVMAEHFGVADLLIAGVLIAWFIFMIVQIVAGGGSAAEAEKPTGEISIKGLLDVILLQGVLVGGIIWSLQTRRVPWVRMFGFRRYSFGQTLKAGLAAIIAAWPVITLIIIATGLILGASAETQPIIGFFAKAVREQQWLAIAATVFTGTIVAPLAEEFVFRGYLYGVIKRYAGPLAALIFTSALFAAIHFNILSLPALFVLAICFTILYELTGSLAVPMVMHALFNSFSLVQTLLVSQIQS